MLRFYCRSIVITMPTRPASAGKKGGKKGDDKKGKKKSSKAGAKDPHQEKIDELVREREEIRSKLNLICSKIIENVNMDDYQNEIDLTKQQPSDISINHLTSMIDQICYYRIAFLNLFQEADDSEKLSVHRKITQLAIDEPEMFQKRLTADQRLTFVIRERDLWKENAQLLQRMYANMGMNFYSNHFYILLISILVDQVGMEIFKKNTDRTEDIVQNHRSNLEDVSLIFASPLARSGKCLVIEFLITIKYLFILVNDAQKLRAKKRLDNVLNDLRDQHAFFELEQPPKQQEITDSTNTLSSDDIAAAKFHSSSRNSVNSERRPHTSSAGKRNVSFADQVNVFNDDEYAYIGNGSGLSPTIVQHQQNNDDNLSMTTYMNSSSLIMSNTNLLDEKYIDSDYHSISSSSSLQHQQYDIPQPMKYSLPAKFRLPSASEVLVNKMDSNLRMLIIKELSKNGHNERPLSRMSKFFLFYLFFVF